MKKIGSPQEWYIHFNNASITKVDVDPIKKSWVLHISLPEIIPLEIWEGFRTRLKQTFQPAVLDLNIQFHYEKLETEVALKKYWYWIQKQIEKNVGISAAGWLGKAKWKISQNQLKIEFSNPTAVEIARRKKLEELVEKYYKQITGRELIVQFVVNKNRETISYLEEERKLQDDMLVREVMEKLPVSEPQGKKSNPKASAPISGEAVPLANIRTEEKRVVVNGKIFKCELKELRSGRQLLTFHLTDSTDSMICKYFFRKKDEDAAFSKIKPGDWVRIRGMVQFDTFSKELVLMANSVEFTDPLDRLDTASEKRVELHLHTSMSSMDGVYDVKEMIKQAAKWGHPAIAITDHGVAQAFPDAYEAGKKHGVKILFGMEANIVDDDKPIIFNPRNEELREPTYVVFDVETTGLSVVHDVIIELAAVKMRNGEIVDRFESFANPHRRVSAKTVELTGITDDMLKGAPEIDDVVNRFLAFMEDGVLVAHNARFDMGFLQEAVKRIGKNPVINTVLDTLELARFLYPGLKNYRLNTLSSRFSIHLEQHHRAIYDAEATAYLMWKMVTDAVEKGVTNLNQLNEQDRNNDFIRVRPYHVVLLVKNEEGLKNLYKLISLSHLNYFYRVPRIPRSELENHRAGLLIGSGCEKGELFDTALNKSYDEVEKVAQFYDYIEIQPIDVNQHLVEKGIVESIDRLREANQLLVKLGEKLRKPVVATSNVHYINPEDCIYREILAMNQTGGFRSTIALPPAYYRTTNEMLREFSYLGDEKAKEVVIKTPLTIANQIKEVKPFPDGTFTPIMEGADEEIYNLSYRTAHEWYGDVLPEIVQKRLDKELNSIIQHGFSNLYLISQKIVAKSLADGYLVGSRGSVGSSFVATLTKITEVNPLPPHYRCPSCKKSEFIIDGSYESGYDLPDKSCEVCNVLMIKDGHDIAFETFLGFEGDKTPDIDLNFASEYQPRAHAYTEDLFGKDYIFRAGTIGTIKEKTAYGFVKKYEEEKSLTLKNAEIDRLVQGCAGVKRTTGQHPGGLMVVPQNMEIYDFTPIQRPADDTKSDIITTHFDYRSISGRILKLDILGHTAPSILKMLEEMTGVDPTTVPCDDPKVMDIFRGTKTLGITPEDINGISIGTLGIPEFGTVFARGILEDTRPKTVSELTRISGLSHGTDVWAGNAQELIKQQTCTLLNAICNRDDIMSYLIQKGLPEKSAFTIMEKVRKGKKLTDDEVKLMGDCQVPQWYIDSCLKIKYLFPRAHAAAYVISAVRIAYFKVHYPKEFYASLFSKNVKDFDIQSMLKGYDSIRKLVESISEKGFQASVKEKGLLTVLESAQEMYARGISFKPVDLYKSHATKFVCDGDQLLPPFASINGVGESVAFGIMNAREDGEFLSIDDFQKRTRASSTIVDALKEMGCIEGLSQSNQLSLFG